MSEQQRLRMVQTSQWETDARGDAWTEDYLDHLCAPLVGIVPLAERMEMLAALACVDYVTPFETRTPVPLIEEIRPAVYVKGGDYREEDLPEAAVVRAYGGAVRLLLLVAGRSTTDIIARVCAAYGLPPAAPKG